MADRGDRGVPEAGGERPALGLALAGGGPQGAVYEIGALRALDEVLEGAELHRLGVYVGVSAGSFVAAALANGIDTAQLCRSIASLEPEEHPFNAEKFLTPSLGEWGRRAASTPRLFFEGLVEYLRRPLDNSLLGTLTRLGRALPPGLFDNEPLREYLETIFAREGRTDDFRELDAALYVVAVDLDTSEAVLFGGPEHGDVPISRAVQASTALPGFYPPVEIDGRFYVDGVLRKTVHASVALDAGAELLLCVNPIVPVDTSNAVARGVMRRGKLVDRGLPAVLSQTFRTLVNSRLEVGMRAYEGLYEGKDWVVFQPRPDDYAMFFTNIFSFDQRVEVCRHAWEQTRLDLRERYQELRPVLARHGILVREDVLFDDSLDLWASVGSRPPRVEGDGSAEEPPDEAPVSVPATTRRLSDTLDRLERQLDRVRRVEG